MSWEIGILLFLLFALGVGAVISALDFREGDKDGIKNRRRRIKADKTV